MQKPSSLDNEDERLNELLDYKILDTESEPSYDDIALLASSICGVPVALISLVDKERQWFKAKVGTDTSETDRDISFCGHAIHETEIFVVPDAKDDKRFFDNPLVESGFVRFYAGAPLISANGYALGTLCVIDQKPRSLTIEQIHALKALARQVSRNMELGRSLSILNKKYSEITHLTKIVSRQKADLIEAAKISAIGTLTAGVAHEVNNPLAIILGKCQRVKNGVAKGSYAKEKILDDLSIIENSAGRISNVTKGMLMFYGAYEDSGFSNLETGTIFDQVLALCRERIKLAGIALELVEIPDIRFEGSAGLIVQVLINLINNAFDAVQFEDKKWIRLSVFDQGEKVIFSVMDSGPGIPKDNVHTHFVLEVPKSQIDKTQHKPAV
ncbi:MAG: GAF domain-containing protein [Pseudobdellovibrionaceae bacterium]|nr:GAF domain-containing protein [Pseudobdellovibrionaceae bacterium]